MEGLLSHHPAALPFSVPVPLDAHYPSRSSNAYSHKLSYPPQHNDLPSLYDQQQPFSHHPRYPLVPQALQIQSAHPAPHEHDLDDLGLAPQ